MKATWLLMSVLCATILGCTPNEKDIFSFRVSAAEPDQEAAFQNMREQVLMASTVKIICNGSRSSGANTPYGILTCAHCVQYGHKIVVQCGSEITEATIIKIDAAIDLALLSVKWTKDHGELEVCTKQPADGDTIFSSGRGIDGTISINSHTVAEGSMLKEIRVKVPFNHGRSGSPVVNNRNAIVGIASKMDRTYEPYTGLAVSTEAVRSFLPATPMPQDATSKRRVVIASAVWCQPCVNFKATNKDGNGSVEFVYIDIEKPMPPTVSQEEWDRAICTVKGMYGPNVEKNMPLALWRTPKGKWYSKTVGGMKTAEVQKWVD